MDGFGARLQELRKELKLSQAELALKASVSQATISRLEGLESAPSDVRLLTKIAKAVNRPLADFLPERSAKGEEAFWAFCPNPRCLENKRDFTLRIRASIKWDSWACYPTEEFEEANFCPSCGTELVKECPSCKRRFSRVITNKYCIKCGEEIFSRPTEETLTQIAAEHAKLEAELFGDSEIPF